MFKTNYILIDYENVQPKNLKMLSAADYQIYLFLGAKQTQVKADIAMALQAIGERARYVRVTQTRSNALDFHIAYYLGRLSKKTPEAYFHIISKDKGYDPLIEHLKTQGVKAYRRDSIPISNISKDAKLDEKVDAIVSNLVARGQSIPRKEKTLKNTIKNTFEKNLKDEEVAAIYKNLIKLKYISLNNGKVIYSLPKP